MEKTVMLRARVTARHQARIAELGRQAGLNTSQVVRVLIENAKLEPRPVPVSTVNLAGEGSAEVSEAQAATPTVIQ